MNRDLEFYIENLANLEFFKNLSGEDLTAVKSNSIIHQYSKGQILFFQQDLVNYYYFVLKGYVKLDRRDSEDRFFYVDYIKENSFFPYRNFAHNNYYGYSAMTKTDVDLLLLPKALFESIIGHNYDQLLLMYNQLAHILNYHELRIQMTLISSAYDRVVQTVSLLKYDMAKMEGQEAVIHCPITINEIAEYAGTTRETAGKVMRNLVEEGRLAYSHKIIRYIDTDYFDRLIET